MAIEQECIGIVSMLNEPAANYYPFRELAVLAKENYLLLGCTLLKPWTKHSCKCGYNVPVKGIAPMGHYNDIGFRGYRITRACGMVRSVLSCLGVVDDGALLNLWKNFSDDETLLRIQSMTQHPCSYLDFIRLISEKAGLEQRGEKLEDNILKLSDKDRY